MSDRGQYVAYTFYRVDPAWRRLPIEERDRRQGGVRGDRRSVRGSFEHLRAYSCTGVRPDCDFFLWKITERYDLLGELGAALNATPLAGWLETPYSYLATTKASQYTSARKARKVTPRNSPYLVVYPFVKTRPGTRYRPSERQDAMDEHIRIGAEFASIHNHTTYSFGIDDQEFMTVFECEEPADFMHLMLTLRETEASSYTERDTPIFVGQLHGRPRLPRRARRSVGARRGIGTRFSSSARACRSSPTLRPRRSCGGSTRRSSRRRRSPRSAGRRTQS